MSPHPIARSLEKSPVAGGLLDYTSPTCDDDPATKEDKGEILRMLYGHERACASIVILHASSGVVHKFLTNAQAIGITWCGTRVVRATQHQWTPVSAPITCIGCLAEDRDE